MGSPRRKGLTLLWPTMPMQASGRRHAEGVASLHIAQIAGFFPAFVTPYDPSEHPLMVDQGAAHLLGFFPVGMVRRHLAARFAG
jgi:hypothetical protein